MPNIRNSDLIDGVLLIDLDVHPDDRGRLLETFRQSWLVGRPSMVQGTRSDSKRGTVRALHFHRHQADYWYCPVGRLYVGLHDMRRSSPTRGATESFELTDDRAVYIPPGVAHGFQALTDATLTYLVDRTYDPDVEHGVAWDDPDIGVPWPLKDALLSDRDRSNPRRRDIPEAELPD